MTRGSRRAATLLGCLGVTAALAAGCGGSDDTSATSASTDSAKSGEPITIGYAIAKSGNFSVYDPIPFQTAQLYVDELNKKGGIDGRKVKLIAEDTTSDPSKGPSAVLKLIDQGASIILTSCDFDQGSPAALTAQSKGMLAMSMCAGSAKFGPGGIGKLAFSMGTLAETEGAAAAEWGYDKKGWKTAYTLNDTTLEYDKAYMAGFEHRWKELAGADGLLGSDSFEQGDQSLSTQIAKIQSLSKQPDVIVFCSYGAGLVTAVKQIRAAGIDTPILGCEATEGAYWLKSVPGLKDYYLTNYGSTEGDDSDETVNHITEEYKKRYGKAPAASIAYMGWADMQVLEKAIRDAGGTDGNKLAAAMEKMDGFPTVVGPTTFTPDLHISKIRTLTVMENKDGGTHFVEKVTPTKALEPQL